MFGSSTLNSTTRPTFPWPMLPSRLAWPQLARPGAATLTGTACSRVTGPTPSLRVTWHSIVPGLNPAARHLPDGPHHAGDHLAGGQQRGQLLPARGGGRGPADPRPPDRHLQGLGLAGGWRSPLLHYDLSQLITTAPLTCHQFRQLNCHGWHLDNLRLENLYYYCLNINTQQLTSYEI